VQVKKQRHGNRDLDGSEQHPRVDCCMGSSRWLVGTRDRTGGKVEARHQRVPNSSRIDYAKSSATERCVAADLALGAGHGIAFLFVVGPAPSSATH